MNFVSDLHPYPSEVESTAAQGQDQRKRKREASAESDQDGSNIKLTLAEAGLLGRQPGFVPASVTCKGVRQPGLCPSGAFPGTSVIFFTG